MRIALSLVCCLLLGASSAFAAEGAAAPAKPQAAKAIVVTAGPEGATKVTLTGSDARQQLLVTATLADGGVRDVTREAKFAVQPAEVARVTAEGLVIATANGSATVTAKTPDGLTGTFALSVEKVEEQLPINFANSVVPVFTKAGCNSGGCHGKSGGQNGFRLSLLGFEPGEDYEHLVKEARGRRLFPGSPENSLLLTKAVGTVPHGGGKRMDADSDDYRLVVRWISQGMPTGQPTDPTVSQIAVHPAKRVMARGGSQQLVVLAHYTDGSVQDVTRSALYEANEQEMARISPSGHVSIAEQPGDVAVMVRYQGKVATFRATVPLGVEVANLPPAKNYVDELVFKKLKEIGMPPSAVCDDATFVRRATVDIAGRLPTPDEVTTFVADKGADKRDKLVDRLLDSPDHADYFANKWSNLLRNKRVQPAYARGTLAFHAWVRDSIAANKPYDQFVREVITASGDVDTNPAVGWYRQVKEPGAQLEDTAQLFLGMRLQCAQCHHHPFERWSQQDYFSFSAFFSKVGRGKAEVAGEEVIFSKRGEASAVNLKTKQKVTPAGLGDAKPMPVSADVDPREQLADWMTRKGNPFFAKSLTNRYWKHFFGRGIVDPEDDMRDTNPPTNPELLDALASRFEGNNFDLKQLIRDICRSTTYQLSSEPNAHNAVDRQNFSRYYPKRLQAEVLLDGVNQLTGTDSKFDGMPAGTRAVQLPDNSFNATSYFLTVFGRPDASSSCECERSGEPSLAQSLHLLNAKDINDKIAAGGGRAAKLAADKRPDEEKVRELYLWAFARQPDDSELATAVGHIKRLADGPAKPAADAKPAEGEKPAAGEKPAK
ncbi:MAG TPA: DUF1549 domain-containing protein, partial [Humisphaera sp.]